MENNKQKNAFIAFEADVWLKHSFDKYSISLLKKDINASYK